MTPQNQLSSPNYPISLAIKTLLLLVFAFVFGSCQSLRVDLHHLPPETRTLYIHNFSNNTFEGGASQTLFNSLYREIQRRDNFRLTDQKDEAALWLYGELNMFRREGAMYDNYNNPVRYDLEASCQIRLRRHHDNRIAGQAEVLYTGEHSARAAYSEQEGYRESDARARERLMFLLASKITTALETAFAAKSPKNDTE